MSEREFDGDETKQVEQTSSSAEKRMHVTTVSEKPRKVRQRIAAKPADTVVRAKLTEVWKCALMRDPLATLVGRQMLSAENTAEADETLVDTLAAKRTSTLAARASAMAGYVKLASQRSRLLATQRNFGA